MTSRSRAASSVLVPVVEIGIMRMSVHERTVAVPVGVRLALRIATAVRVPVVLVVHMTVLVLHRRVLVLMLVPLGQVQVEAKRHEAAGHE